jgi:hypothetical protein
MSFAFRVIRQNWSKDRTERTLTEVSLADGDVSVVTYPAYPTTSVEARQKIAMALDAIKEGRKLDEDSIKALRDYLSDLLESEDEEDSDMEEEVETESVRSVEPEETQESTEEQGRKISLRLAKAIVARTK